MTDTALAQATSLIADFEEFRSNPYQDSGGTWTIGFGFTYNTDGSPVTANTPPISRPDAEVRLGSLVGKFMAQVRGMVYVPITDCQAAALCSFAYNEGTNRLRTSALLLSLNQHKLDDAANGFLAYVLVKGQYSHGLYNRRVKERALFLATDATDTLNAAELARIHGARELTADDLNAAELARIHSQNNV